MKKEDVPKGAMVTYKNQNDAKAHAYGKFASYLYENGYQELAEKMQEFLKESIIELYGEN